MPPSAWVNAWLGLRDASLVPRDESEGGEEETLFYSTTSTSTVPREDVKVLPSPPPPLLPSPPQLVRGRRMGGASHSTPPTPNFVLSYVHFTLR